MNGRNSFTETTENCYGKSFIGIKRLFWVFLGFLLSASAEWFFIGKILCFKDDNQIVKRETGKLKKLNEKLASKIFIGNQCIALRHLKCQWFFPDFDQNILDENSSKQKLFIGKEKAHIDIKCNI